MPPVTFAHILGELAHQESTGCLELGASESPTKVYFSRGRPVFVERGPLGQTLGRMLVRLGRITPEQYSAVIHRMTEHLVANEEIRFGEVLVELGIMDGGQVFEVLGLQVQEKLLGCFTLTDVSHVFHEGREYLEDVQAFEGPSARALILKGIKRSVGPEQLRQQLVPFLNHYPKLLGDPSSLERDYGMDANESRLLRSFDGTVTLSAAWDASTLERDHAGHVIVATMVSKDMELATTAPVKPGTRRKLITRSKGKAGTPAPQRLARLRLKRLSENQARLLAETAFQTGKQALRQKILVRAQKEFQKAVDLFPGPLEYQLYAAWARFLLVPPEDDATVRRDRVRALAEKAIKLDQTPAFAHYVEGFFRQQEGNGKGAIESLRKAAELDEDDVDVQRELRLLLKRFGG